MNYYKRHIGDYAKKAGHLSLVEHGIYTLLLDAYYDREQAPTKPEAIRQSRARTPDELLALDAVLGDFFTLVNGRYVQSRAEQEFILAEQIAAKNQENGKRGGRPRKPKGTQKEPSGNPEETQWVIFGNPDVTQMEPKANPNERQSTNPLIHQLKEESKALVQQAARFDEFWRVYPVKKGKADAEKKWKSLKLDDIADTIISDVLTRAEMDRQWLDGYIPHGSTYINKRGWLDGIQTTRPTQAATKSKTLTGIESLQREINDLAENGNYERASAPCLLESGSDSGF